MKTIEQIALEVANNQYEFIWTEGCGYECGVLPQEAIDFAKAFLAAVDAERGEPVAWSYTSKITGAETLTHQPPDRVIEHEQFVIHPLYLAPQPTSADMEDAGRYRWAADHPIEALDIFGSMRNKNEADFDIDLARTGEES